MTPTLTPADLTTHDGYRSLMRAVIAQPDEDTPRLAMADWLEEHGDSARAEFIRVGVELAQVDWLSRPFRSRVYRIGPECRTGACAYCRPAWLRARSDALLREHKARWRRGGRCEKCEGHPGLIDGPRGEWRPTAAICPTCRGTGWRGPLGEQILDYHLATRPEDVKNELVWRHRVTWERGFIGPQVDCNLDDAFANGAVTDWARSVVECEPVTRFGIVDRPAREGPRGLWYTELDDDPFEHNLSEAMRDPNTGRFGRPTAAAANRALAEAVGTVAREAAGIGGKR